MAETRPTRSALVTHLDRLVRTNRFTIAVVVPAVGAVLLVASAEEWLAGSLGFNPWLVLIGALVMRSPLIVGMAPLVDRRAALGVLVLAAYAYGIEFVAVTTGWPYGSFRYAVDLGPTIGGVPLALPVLYLPIVLNAYLLCLLVLGDRAASAAVRLPAVVAAVVCMDLVLDPGAVALGFWVYAAGGPLYGVPLSNVTGWVLSATLTVGVLDRTVARPALLARIEECPYVLDDLVSFVVFWGAINLWFGNPLPIALAALFGLTLAQSDRFDVGTLRPVLPSRP